MEMGRETAMRREPVKATDIRACNLIAAAGSIVSIFPVLPPLERVVRRDPADDARAIAGDWARVGSELRMAMGRLDKELAATDK